MTSATRARFPGSYPVRQVAGVLAAFAATGLLLDSEGLWTWVLRLEVGAGQDAWMAVLGPVRKGLDSMGLSAPRRALLSRTDALAVALGPRREAATTLELAAIEPEEPKLEPAGAPVPEEPAAEPRKRRPGPAVVLLVGDSLMEFGLAPAIDRAVKGDPTVRIAHAHQIASGLNRPEVLDWFRVARFQLQRQDPDLVVVIMGGNDAGRARLDGVVEDFGTDAWDAAYRKKARAMMELLASDGRRVLWLGLPPMRAKDYGDRTNHLNQLFSEEARAVARVDFVETAPAVAAPDGGFATWVQRADGRPMRVRNSDGVHFTAAGGRVVAHDVLLWLTRHAPDRMADARP